MDGASMVSDAALHIRPAHAEEIAALEALQMRASLAWGDHVEELTANPDAVAIPPAAIANTWVAEREGEVVGFATLLPWPGAEAELDALFVEPSLWRGGVGRRLLEEADARARAMKARTIRVVANPRAVGFYRRCGYEVTGETQTRFAPAPVMEKRL